MWEIREYLKNIITIMAILFLLCFVIIKIIIGNKKPLRKEDILLTAFLIYIFALTTQAIIPKFIITLKR